MTAAIFGLVGVLVGGIVPAVMQYVIARAELRNSTQANARLLAVSLERVHKALEDRLTSHPWLPAESWVDDLATEGWNERLDLLAKGLTGQRWSAIARACARVDSLRGGIAARWDSALARDPQVSKELVETLDSVESALHELSLPRDRLRPLAALRRGIVRRPNRKAMEGTGTSAVDSAAAGSARGP